MRNRKLIYILFVCLTSIAVNLTAAPPYATKYISVLGLVKDCDISNWESKDPRDYIQPDAINPGDVIWVQSYYLPIFYRDCLPKIDVPFVLVISRGDESFPTSHEHQIDIEDLISNLNIVHIFAQNCDYTGPQIDKVSPLPIGIDVHTLVKASGAFDEVQQTSQEQEALLEKIIRKLKPTNKRIKKALVEFHLNDTLKNGWGNHNRYLDPGETRQSITEKIANSNVIDLMATRLPRRDYWKLQGEYTFSICPPGNGLDTHRTWESLLLGCIVIVKSSPMDRLYEGLPVVIIQDWSEINQENFDKWSDQYGDVLHNPQYRKRLELAYWIAQIRSYSNNPIDIP